MAAPKTPRTDKKVKPKRSPRAVMTARTTKAPAVITHTDLDEEADDQERADSDEIDEVEEIQGEPSKALAVPADETAPATDFSQNQALKRYLAEISKYSLLSPEEEFALATKLKETGDLAAAKHLVSANLRLVVRIAMEYRSAYQNVLDLIQEGNIGLMKAVSKYDPLKGAKLSYYASWWIRSYILKYILDNFRLVRVGTTQAQKKLFFHLVREKERLEAQGIEAGPKLLADKLQVREKDIVEMEQRLGGQGSDLSLDRPMEGEDGGKASFKDMVADPTQGVDDELSLEELKSILNKHLGGFTKLLTDKERVIFNERLNAESPLTLQEVADKFGLTRERVRQIETKIIEKLRTFFKEFIR